MDELSGRRDFGIGPQRPASIVEIELRDHVGQIDIGFPIGVDRAHVPPIALRLASRPHARVGEVMRDGLCVLHHVGNDVLAEVARRSLGCGIAAKFFKKPRRPKDVDSERAERDVGLSGYGGRIRRLLEKSRYHVILIDGHDSESARFGPRHFYASNRDIGTGRNMLAQHHLVVHLVDVIAGEDHHVLRRITLDDVDILKNGVRGSFVPESLGDALRRRQDVETLVTFRAEKVPALLQVTDQRMRFVLRGDGVAPNARVDSVRQREVDDPGLAAEIDGRLSALVRQFLQPSSAPSRQNIGHRIACQRMAVISVHGQGSPSGTRLRLRAPAISAIAFGLIWRTTGNGRTPDKVNLLQLQDGPLNPANDGLRQL